MSEGFEELCRVRPIARQGMITLRGDLSAKAVKNAVTGVAGVDMPSRREARHVGERAILWMSPDELAVLVPHEEAAVAAETMRSALAGIHALVADVSDARAHFRLEGDTIREVIAKLAPVDMSPAAMQPGMVRRTRFAQVAAGFWLRDEATAQVFCFRSVADYMSGLLRTAATPGSAVGYF
ncbi:sarcosine oxidase subunit gamma [Thetidibacter halocola]|uniref:Sarcosine oxidase subunit gamma n=1 Tax=Thetidibacter halocola TaxID=2827239 RepID=A0A8J7WEX3_9RHOB|nr:sarcosine oxidase subunit gamma family protein [Thetidibacter halocola]MBS0124136.1 sarcosine oxidase subunit gamma [Thetidibacter halocola]